MGSTALVDDEDENKKCCDWRHWWPRLIIIGVLLLLVVLAIVYRSEVSKAIQDFLTWVQNHRVSGPLILALVYVVCTVCLVPGSLLTLGAGWAFQQAYGSTGIAVLVGSVSVFVGAMIGLIIAFLLGRFVLRQCSEKFAMKYRVTKALDHAFRTEGLKVVALLRMCPLVPFTYFNYVMGITSVSFIDYSVGSLAILPGTITYVFIGTTIGSI